MARLARLSIGGYPHLVVQRSEARPIVSDGVESGRLLALLRESATMNQVALHAYALLPQAIWLVATPADGTGLGRLMQAVGRRYVRWVNEQRGGSGSLFGGRYRAALLEPETMLLDALRYVEAQPVTCGAAASPQDYAWSSYRQHVGLASDPAIEDHAVYWALGNTPFDRQAAYRARAEQPLSSAIADDFERALRGGWVVGSPDFVRQISLNCPRRPVRAQPGRPRTRPPVEPSRSAQSD